MEKLSTILKGIFFALVGWATWRSFELPAVTAPFSDKDLARIIFFHLPCALNTPLLLGAATFFSFKYLRTADIKWDIRAKSVLDLTNILSILTLVTGMLFSKVQWGGWWDWDPRQSSFLLVECILGGYFLLRISLPEKQQLARFSSAYVLMASLPIFFLIFVFPRLPPVARMSNHPTNTIMQGGLTGGYGSLTTILFVLVLILCIWIYRLSVRSGELVEALEQYGNMETRLSSSAPSRVVRIVPLSDENTEATESS